MTLNRETVFQVFKYIVYSLLAFNVYLFWREEFTAALVEYPHGVPLAYIVDAYATTIDTAAWLVLLLMFELETYQLDDRHFTPTVTHSLHAIRIGSFLFILYAFYGYVGNVLDTYDVATVAGVTDLCGLVGDGYSFAVDYDEYLALTTDNCRNLSASDGFLRFAELQAVVDPAGLRHIQMLAAADAINAFVWILIVVILEIEVQLQERERLTSAAVRMFGGIKILLYSTLMLLAIYWGFDGDFVDFWDAFLWLVAFFFIELNVVEWRQEEQASAEPPGLAST